jgi:regulator of nucleoside diphosphate kinase
MSIPDVICARCGAATAMSLPFCRACGKPYAIESARRGDAPPAHDLSACVIAADDHALLIAHLENHGRRDTFAAHQLRVKLLAASVRLAAHVAPDVVTLNSRVAFRLGRAPVVTRTLVPWGRELDVGLTLPATTPLGIAMLGRKAGETTRYMQRDGLSWTVTIEAVLYQPQAAMKHAASRERGVFESGGAKAERIRIFTLPSPMATAQRMHDDDPGPAAA